MCARCPGSLPPVADTGCPVHPEVACNINDGVTCVQRFDAPAFAAGGKACKPRILGIGVDSGHHEHRSPSPNVATDARGCGPRCANQSPGPSAAGAEHVQPWRSRDQGGPDRGRPQHERLETSCSFQRSMTAFASARAAASATCGLALMAMSRPPRPHAHSAVSPESGRATIAPPDVSPRRAVSGRTAQ
jgi:hypothetical protein